MTDAAALYADVGAWSLEALADRSLFDRHYVTVAAAVADRLSAKVNINIEARGLAYADWIDSLQGLDPEEVGHPHFVAACASLIASLARYRIVAYSAIARDPPDRLVNAALNYPNEVTALASGAAVYLLKVRELTGIDPSARLSGMILENAAANLNKTAEAAVHFRELLRLSTPWD